MADGKWITGLTPEMPTDEAARVVLSVRLAAVRHHLPLAVERAAEDVEHVHQLRVATRRAGAAVRIFRDLLPKKSQREAKRVLRAVRRAAGAARDWDVFLARSRFVGGRGRGLPRRVRPAGACGGPGRTRRGRGRAVRRDPRQSARPSPPRSDTRPARSLSEHAAAVLGDLFARFAAEVDANPTAAAELHQLRITAKRLRYAMEVFVGCCAPPLREVLYPAVEEVQEILGGVQDAAVVASRLEQFEGELRYLPGELADRLRPGVAALADDVKGKAAQGEQRFRQWAERW